MIHVTSTTRAKITELQAVRDRLQHMRPAYIRAGVVVLKAAKERIDAGGPGWAPNKSGTSLLHKTGRLLNSLTVGGASNIDDATDTSVKVGTNVPYARYLQEGTGVYAGRGKISRPRSKTQGPSKPTNGMPARPFLFIDAQTTSTIKSVILSYVVRGIDAGN